MKLFITYISKARLLVVTFVLVLTIGQANYYNTTANAATPIARAIYQDAERNGVADGMCRAIDFMNFIIIPISALMFVILGYTGLKGQLNFSSIVTFAIAIGGMRGAGAILEMYLPGRGLKYGCKCATYVIVPNPITGIPTWTFNGLDENCQTKLQP